MKRTRRNTPRVTANVGVKMTEEETEALRHVAFIERTTKSAFLRKLFLDWWGEHGIFTLDDAFPPGDSRNMPE